MPRPSSVVANWKPKLEAWLNEQEVAYLAHPAPSQPCAPALDPRGKESYETLKAQVIAGEITVEEAHARTLEHFRIFAAEQR